MLVADTDNHWRLLMLCKKTLIVFTGWDDWHSNYKCWLLALSIVHGQYRFPLYCYKIKLVIFNGEGSWYLAIVGGYFRLEIVGEY